MLSKGDFKVTERKVVMKELIGALNDGRVLEVFGSGTACVVCPVGSLLYREKVIHTTSPYCACPLTVLCLNICILDVYSYFKYI